MKLHLGCGENYLQGYENIDFPKSEHTVQQKNVADKHADILKLKYPADSIDEIRLHHVFEHFSRFIACALLVCWRSWLVENGVLRLEVPDFTETAKIAIRHKKDDQSRNVALRHIFGSQEAPWAIHYEGWSEEKLGGLLKKYGFNILKVLHTKYKGTCNIEIIATKLEGELNKNHARSLTRDFLSSHLVDSSPTENRLLSTWMKMYDEQIERSWPKQ